MLRIKLSRSKALHSSYYVVQRTGIHTSYRIVLQL